MILKTSRIIAAGSVFLFFANISANNEDVVLTPTGSGGIEVGQIAQGYYKSPGSTQFVISHVWQQRANATIGYNALIKKRLEISISAGGLMAFSTPQIGSLPTTMQTRPFFYINSAYAAYPFGDPKNIYCKVQGGYFPYKYNPEVRNLGEYLFRTNSYPLLVYSDFDYPQVNLLGVRANLQAFGGMLSNDILIHSELLGIPVQDWSISDIVSVNLFDMLTLGGGLSFTHLLSAYQGRGYGTMWVDGYYTPANLDSTRIRYFIVRDTVNGTIFYDTLDWRATKLMFRFSFDPKKLIRYDIFGTNDLKVYAEADIIGLKNYRQYEEFKYLENRTLAVIGVNLPGFRYVDLINLEMEYCANSTSAFSDELLFSPSSIPSLRPYLLPATIKRVPWRWSVYLKKTVLDGHIGFIAQFARDHKKLNFYYWERVYMSFMETLPTNKDWWWSFKTEFKF